LKDGGDLPYQGYVLLFDVKAHTPFLESHLDLKGVPQEWHDEIKDTVRDFWDWFDPSGVIRPIRGYEFIYTDDSALLACYQTQYGMYESLILQKQIDTLKSQGLLEYEDGPWASKAILAAK
jgi:hypothetical protein